MFNVHQDAHAFFAEAYRTGFVPWERAAAAGADQEARLFDAEDAAHPAPSRRALDIGCGRGHHALMLADRGWRVTGVDFVAEAVDAARRLPGAERVDFVVGDAADLTACVTGPFDFFLDGGCFHGLGADERAGWGRGVVALAAPDATLLMVAFDPWPDGQSAPPNAPVGTTLDEIMSVLPGWTLIADESMPDAYRPVPQPAHFYRLRRGDG